MISDQWAFSRYRECTSTITYIEHYLERKEKGKKEKENYNNLNGLEKYNLYSLYGLGK